MKFAFSSLLAATVFSLVFTSCKTGSNREGLTYFDDVRYYHLNLDNAVETPDPMMRFEQQHYLHGAVTGEERKAREGHYYTLWWNTEDTSTPATVRFEYRQKETGPLVHVIEVPIDRISSRNKTRITVTGDAYQTNGKVTAWRAQLLRNGEIVSEEKSYLWN